MSSSFYLPSKVTSYLKRLELEYARNAELSEIMSSARVYVREQADLDPNDGTSGHIVLFFLPTSTLEQITLNEQDRHCTKICEDLNRCARSVADEYISRVIFELDDENDLEFQRSFSIHGQVQIDPDALSIWKPGQIRLFISHRDVHKVAARALADSLEEFGISAFVAHDTIQPMSTWQAEIIRGLQTMEIMLAYVTDDFHESIWVNQEIGFALGRNIPVISLKLQKKDPVGFIGEIQALRGRFESPENSVSDIYKILAERLGNKGRLQSALVAAFASSPDFDETKRRFNRLNDMVTSLSDDEVERITAGFAANDQLHNAYYLVNHRNRLLDFLKRTTGRNYAINANSVSAVD